MQCWALESQQLTIHGSTAASHGDHPQKAGWGHKKAELDHPFICLLKDREAQAQWYLWWWFWCHRYVLVVSKSLFLRPKVILLKMMLVRASNLWRWNNCIMSSDQKTPFWIDPRQFHHQISLRAELFCQAWGDTGSWHFHPRLRYVEKCWVMCWEKVILLKGHWVPLGCPPTLEPFLGTSTSIFQGAGQLGAATALQGGSPLKRSPLFFFCFVDLCTVSRF